MKPEHQELIKASIILLQATVGHMQNKEADDVTNVAISLLQMIK